MLVGASATTRNSRRPAPALLHGPRRTVQTPTGRLIVLEKQRPEAYPRRDGGRSVPRSAETPDPAAQPLPPHPRTSGGHELHRAWITSTMSSVGSVRSTSVVALISQSAAGRAPACTCTPDRHRLLPRLADRQPADSSVSSRRAERDHFARPHPRQPRDHTLRSAARIRHYRPPAGSYLNLTVRIEQQRTTTIVDNVPTQRDAIIAMIEPHPTVAHRAASSTRSTRGTGPIPASQVALIRARSSSPSPRAGKVGKHLRRDRGSCCASARITRCSPRALEPPLMPILQAPLPSPICIQNRVPCPLFELPNTIRRASP